MMQNNKKIVSHVFSSNVSGSSLFCLAILAIGWLSQVSWEKERDRPKLTSLVIFDPGKKSWKAKLYYKTISLDSKKITLVGL